MTLAPLDDGLFLKFQRLVFDACGIALSSDKRMMLQVRLGRRLQAHGFDTYQQYYDYISDENFFDDEVQNLLNAVTTNKTDFYRESHHFEYLSNTLVPELMSRHRFTSINPLRIWSAGCSSGEEPYTIAIELAELLGTKENRFSVLATDISTKVLKHAMRGIYNKETVAPIPDIFKKKYLLRGKKDRTGYCRIVPELKKCIQFGILNFTDHQYQLPHLQHIIFCRNVLIYFNEQTRNEIIHKLCNCLAPGGTLFIGHSETLNPSRFGLLKVLPTIYAKQR